MNKSMLSSDYEIKDKIYQGKHSVIFRAVKISGNRPVIIKTVINNSRHEAKRLKNEYDIGNQLSHENIIKYIDYIPYKNRMAVIMEDFGSGSIKDTLPKKGFTLKEFLPVAIQIVNALKFIHRKNFIHKDINPSNILINSENNKIKITGFSISSIPSPHAERIYNFNNIKGTIHYISPEQTGRLNRPIDYRTDFYSLGITFYEILSGQLPFYYEDPFDIIHGHLALNPFPLHKIKPEIPETVSRVISKLMNKNPEDRYKNCNGIKKDMERCLLELNRSGKINSFQIGEKDFSNELQIPQKLYGREKETEKLSYLYKRVCDGSFELLMVKGDAGTGKSALVNDLRNNVLNHKGNFISGKFNESGKNIAYNAGINAIKQLINKILAGSKEEIDVWKIKLLDALGVKGQIAIDIIRELEFIIGPQPVVPNVSPLESKNRFENIFISFIKALTSPEHPLVFFLDDLQWADSASIDLLKLLAKDQNIQNLLLIGAYRENEIEKSHPLATILKEIDKTGINVNYVTLLPLNTEYIKNLISETLSITTGGSGTLAELIHKKTGGNIFFVREFLYNLYRKKLLSFDEVKGWRWETEKIKKLDVTDNVVKFIAEKIKEFPEDTKEALKLASCIGSSFTLKTLSLITGLDEKEILQKFFKANDKGILTDTEDGYKFAHDRIFEAVYSLVSNKQKKEIHYKIGRSLLNDSIRNDQLDESIFQIVNQFNQMKEHIIHEFERLDFADLNLTAGRKSKASTAFSQALYYFLKGLDFLPKNSLEKYYKIAFPLMVNIAECEYLKGNYNSAEKKFKDTLNFARDKYDRAEVYRLMIIFFTQIQNTKCAVECLREGLKLFNFDLPFKGKNNKTLVHEEKMKVDKLLGKMDIDDILNLHVMNNADNLSILNLIVSGLESLFYYDIDILYLAITKSISLSCQFGNSKYTSITYVVYGIMLANEFNQLSAGCQFGELSFRLDEKLNNSKFNNKLTQLYGPGINHWRENISNSINVIRESYKKSKETGNIISAMINLSNYLAAIQVKGKELDFLYSECQEHLPAFENFNNQYILNIVKLIKQYARALKGKTFSPISLSDREFDEESVFNEIKKQKIKTQLYHYYRNKEVIIYLCGDTDSALKAAGEAEKYHRSISGLITCIIHPFYYSLILLKHCHTASPGEKKKSLKIISKNRDKIKIWADNCPENFLHKHLLIEAELAQLSERYDEAAELYNKAIESARKNGFKQDEAIGYELAAIFHLNRKMKSIAEIYMTGAHKCYNEWGATAKVKQLEEKYPELLAENLADRNTGKNPKKQIYPSQDITSIINASQSLSSEIKLENLLIKLMRILIKNAGAEKACLILNKNDKLSIEAELDFNSGEMVILQSVPLNESCCLSVSIVNLVSRTGEDIILDNASKIGNFKNDPYIKKFRPMSIICTPIMSKGKQLGILYLENNITTGAFTPESAEILKILSYQAAISIENARLYDRQENALEDLKTINMINERLFSQYNKSNLKNLQKRANPHFLFNAIHTIHGLMVTDFDKAENAIIMLGEIYHFISDTSFKSLISFNEEWDFVKNYLEFEKINSPETISFEIEKSGNFSDVNIPPLTIQPLIENSIKHGLKKIGEKEYLKIIAKKINDRVIIEVWDNGTGLENEDVYSGTLGNIRDRLRYHFNKSDLQVSNAEGGGVKALISYSYDSGNILWDEII